MQVENGLVETLAVLISKMPRLRPSLPTGDPGQAFNFKPEFSKASYCLPSFEIPASNSRFFVCCG